MSTAEKTETKPDTRTKVAGHPLPWSCVHCEEEGDLLFIDDANGKAVFANLDHRHRDKDGEPIVPDSFFKRLTNDVNRLGLPSPKDTSFVLSTPSIPERPRLSVERCPEGDAVFQFNDGLTKQMTREEMHDHMQRVILLDVASQQRIAALEAALVKVASMFTSDWDGKFETSEVAETRAILTDLGLAERLPGNPKKAEGAVS